VPQTQDRLVLRAAHLVGHRFLHRARGILEFGLHLAQLFELHFAADIGLDVVHVALQASEQGPQRTGDLGKALRSDDQQPHEHDDEELGETDVEHGR
jgi:hypothetical protein